MSIRNFFKVKKKSYTLFKSDDANKNRTMNANLAPMPQFSSGSKGVDEEMLFNWPLGLCIENYTNNIFISDESNNRVQVLDDTGNFIYSFPQPQQNYEMRNPDGITTYNGLVYIASYVGHIMYVLTLEGDLITKMDFTKSLSVMKFVGPTGLAVNEELGILVCDWGNNRVIRFKDELPCVTRFAESVKLDAPQDIQIINDEVIILDRDRDGCVKHFNFSGDCIKTHITLGDNDCDVGLALFFAVDLNGDIIISEWNRSCISIFNSSGRKQYTIGKEGLKKGEFYKSSGIAVDTKNTRIVSISHKLTDSVQIFKRPCTNYKRRVEVLK